MVLFKLLSEKLLSLLLVLLLFVVVSFNLLRFYVTFPSNFLCSYWAVSIIKFGDITGFMWGHKLLDFQDL